MIAFKTSQHHQLTWSCRFESSFGFPCILYVLKKKAHEVILFIIWIIKPLTFFIGCRRYELTKTSFEITKTVKILKISSVFFLLYFHYFSQKKHQHWFLDVNKMSRYQFQKWEPTRSPRITFAYGSRSISTVTGKGASRSVQTNGFHSAIK